MTVLWTPVASMHRLWLWFRDRQNRLWVTPMLTGMAAVGLAFAARTVGAMLDASVPDISVDTIDDVLTVIATSMLALAIFCLATLVAALSTSSTTTTPRSTELLMGDSAARASIGSFVAAFIFAIVAKTALGTGYYGEGGRFVLFVSSMVVVAFVVLRLLLWIRSGSRLGRLGDTLERIREVTGAALQAQARQPWMGAAPPGEGAVNAVELRATECGYLTHVNMSGLQALAERSRLRVHLQVRPGAFVTPVTVLARIAGEPDDTCRSQLRACFVLAPARTYDQDARFGLIVLGEVALRALSPSVNDPGTAIQVMSTMAGLLIDHAGEVGAAPRDRQVRFDRLTAPACLPEDLVIDAFAPLARDGASVLEVGVRMQKLLAAIAANAPGPIAAEAITQARHALARARNALVYAPDRERLEELHGRLFP